MSQNQQQHILSLLGDELAKVYSDHDGALADLTQKKDAECEQKVAQK